MYLISFYLLVLLSLTTIIHASVIPTRLLTALTVPFTKSPSSSLKTTTPSNFNPTKNSSFKKNPSSSTSLYNDHSFLYLIEIGIGPKQTFFVAVDTGSSDTWVASSKCPDKDCGLEKYDISSTDSKNDLKEPFSVAYGSGEINGEYYKDTITIGGIKVPNQQFGAVNEVSGFKLLPQSEKNDIPSLDGLLGLGFPGLVGSNKKSYNPIMMTMYEEKLIKDPLFTIFLNSREDHDSYSGEIKFGEIDSNKYQGGELKYIPVVPFSNGQYGHWAFHLNQIKLNDQTYKIDSKDTFIFDTGSSLSYIPLTIFKAITEELKKKGKDIYKDTISGVYAGDCAYAHDEKNIIQFTLPSSKEGGGKPVTITIPFADTLLTDDPSLSSKNICTFGFQPMEEASAKDSNYDGNMYVLGDSVLRSLYLVFNFGEKTIGIAAANNDHGNAATVE